MRERKDGGKRRVRGKGDEGREGWGKRWMREEKDVGREGKRGR